MHDRPIHRTLPTPMIFVCKACGHLHHGWQPRCEKCEMWLSRQTQDPVESPPRAQVPSYPIRRGSARGHDHNHDLERHQRIDPPFSNVDPTRQDDKIDDDDPCIPLSEVDIETVEPRIKTGIDPLDHVLGGGAVLGAMILLGGDPGCGKSTMLGMAARNLAPDPVVYSSGEENKVQVTTRHKRIGAICASILFTHETDIDKIIRRAENEAARILIVDSLHTLRDNDKDAPRGKQNQLVHCTERLMHWAKQSNVPVFIICHINKKQDINGPKAVEHFVDVALMMRPDKQDPRIRHLFVLGKNRCGPSENHGSFLMSSQGKLEPLPVDQDHGFVREEEEDDMTPIAQELLHMLLEAGIDIDKGIRERIGDRLEFTPRSR